MSVLHTLWLPIIVSAVFVYVFSCVLHMFLPWHRGEYKKLPNEDQILDSLRAANVVSGDYMAPGCGPKEERDSPAFKEKMKRGPIVVATVQPGGFSMGQSMVLWFLYILVITYFAAYVAAHAMAFGAPGQLHVHVHRFIAITAFLGYSGALCQHSIWYKRSWLITFKFMIDGALYAAITVGTFEWLWPHLTG